MLSRALDASCSLLRGRASARDVTFVDYKCNIATSDIGTVSAKNNDRILGGLSGRPGERLGGVSSPELDVILPGRILRQRNIEKRSQRSE
jgi:hypothetical protein